MEFKNRVSRYARSTVSFVSRLGSSHPWVSSAMRKLRLSKPFVPTPAAVQAYRAVIADKVACIDRLPPKYRNEAQKLVWNYVMKGYDAPGLARELPNRLGIAPDRARLIARSQCNMARAVMDNAERILRGSREAVWQHNSRCEIRSHSAFSGRKYLLAQGATLDEKRIWPGSEPFCHCSSIEINASERE